MNDKKNFSLLGHNTFGFNVSCKRFVDVLLNTLDFLQFGFGVLLAGHLVGFVDFLEELIRGILNLYLSDVRGAVS